MDNSLFSVPVGMAGRNSIAIDGVVLQTTPNSLIQFDSFNLNNQNHTLAEYTVLSTLQGEPVSDIPPDIQINQATVMDSNASVISIERNVMTDVLLSSSRSIASTNSQEPYVGGTPISGTALATLLAGRSCHQENLYNLAISRQSIYPSEVLRNYVSNDSSNDLNSSFASSVNYGCDKVFGNTNGKDDLDRFPASMVLGGKDARIAGFQPNTPLGNLEPFGWVSSNDVHVSRDNPFGSCKLSNELSLSLATSQHSVMNGISIPDQCSDINCPGETRRCLKETRLGSEQTSCNSKELALSCGSYGAGQFSQVISGSRYLHAIQEILAQVARYSLDQTSYPIGGITTGAIAPFCSSYRNGGGMLPMVPDESRNVDSRFDAQMDPALQKGAPEAKKMQLLTLLQVVDERYNQCLDEIHTVISAFHAATELDPQVHTRFALQTISFFYKSLRERISSQILAMGELSDSGCTRKTEGSIERSYFQKQWTLQQLKKKDHQLWRHQRGLPERSVSVLRAWLFQNFLHPYPKDAEKHLLAVKSGLTRSQVSNWFINARVRLWKPMIEEMYAEMNRRNARQGDVGSNSNHRRQIRNSNGRFNMN